MTTYKETPIRLSANFSSETVHTRRKWHDIFKAMKGRTYNQEHSTQKDSAFDGDIKSFPDKQKLREFSTTKPASQQMLRQRTQGKGKDLQKIRPKQENSNRVIHINHYLK